MTRVLVVGEYTRDILEAVAPVKSHEIYIVVFGPAYSDARKISGIPIKLYSINSRNPESIFKSVKRVFDELKPDLILGVVSKNLRDVLSRLAGLYDLPMATEIVEFKLSGERVIYKRGILSERAYSIEEVETPAIILLNPRIFKPINPVEGGEVIELEPGDSMVKTLRYSRKQLSGVKLEEAEIVIGVGRGFKSKDDLKLAFELAELLGGQVGGSRPIAADLKWLPEDAWIGISGKRISPKLYIAIGISGAPQHMSAVMGTKVIVAVNKDKSAPIFKQSDYGVVADLYQFIPVLIKKLRERKA